jgi:hypothetical protein
MGNVKDITRTSRKIGGKKSLGKHETLEELVEESLEWKVMGSSSPITGLDRPQMVPGRLRLPDFKTVGT